MGHVSKHVLPICTNILFSLILAVRHFFVILQIETRLHYNTLSHPTNTSKKNIDGRDTSVFTRPLTQ